MKKRKKSARRNNSSLVKAKMKRERFAREYVIDQNGTRAAIAAGFSKRSAYNSANLMLKNAEVQTLIAELTSKQAAKLDITAERVLNEIAKLAFVDPRKFFNPDGSAIDITELDADTAAALASVKRFEEYEGAGKNRKFVGYTKEFRIADKGANLERLGKYLKLFTERIELGSDPLAELLEQFRTLDGQSDELET